MPVEAEELSERRTLAGVVLAAEETRLSFAVPGKLLEVPLREGARFAAGQEIARLDPADLQRELSSRRAKLGAAESRFQEADDTFRRQQILASNGTISRVTLARAEAALALARSELRVAEVAIADAEESLRRTRLLAPRDGIVINLLAKQFEEIVAGQPVYEVGTADALEVMVLVPEYLVPTLQYGAAVEVTISSIASPPLRGRIVSISAAAAAGNAFRVRARLEDVPAGLRSGVSASVSFAVGGKNGPVYAVPLSALAFDRVETGPIVGRTASLFIFDGAKGIVQRRDVAVRGMAGNRVFVAQGLTAGERVVTAGVAFLRDGQKARLWTPPE